MADLIIIELDISVKIIQSEQQRENRQKKKNISGSCGTITKELTFVSLESKRRGKERMELNKY